MVTSAPTPPSTSDPSNFNSRADAFVAWLDTFADEINADVIPAMEDVTEAATDLGGASVAAVLNTAYAAHSFSNMTLSTGSKTVVLAQSGKSFAANDLIVAVERTDPSLRMFMTVNSVVGTTLTCTVPSGGVMGSGSSANWLIIHSAFLGSPASATIVRAGSDTSSPITASALMTAPQPQNLTDAATIAWNMGTAINAAVVLGGARTMGQPTNAKAGVTYTLEVVQDATGGRTISWSSTYFDWGAKGTPVLSTGASKRDLISLYCYDAVTPKFRCFIDYAA